MCLFGILMMLMGVVSVMPGTAMAASGFGGSCGTQTKDFLGFKPWYDSLCVAGTDKVAQPKNTDELKTFVWIIVLNVLFDLSLAVGYLAIGFIVYGGYLYIMSQGDPSKVAKGKKTLTAAVIGMTIALSASVLVNTLKFVLGIEGNSWNQGSFTSKGNVMSILNWAYMAAGLVAAAFIVRGGFEYMTSQGDASKVRKATQSIIYAVVGLVIVILAAVITAFLSRSIGGSL